MKTETATKWTETKKCMPPVGQKVTVFVWMDKTVCQAWWNGESYILVAANEEGNVTIYQVEPVAISHWQMMPEAPKVSNVVPVEDWQEKRNGTMH